MILMYKLSYSFIPDILYEYLNKIIKKYLIIKLLIIVIIYEYIN